VEFKFQLDAVGDCLEADDYVDLFDMLANNPPSQDTEAQASSSGAGTLSPEPRSTRSRALEQCHFHCRLRIGRMHPRPRICLRLNGVHSRSDINLFDMLANNPPSQDTEAQASSSGAGTLSPEPWHNVHEYVRVSSRSCVRAWNSSFSLML
jgi:hypothetical protein